MLKVARKPKTNYKAYINIRLPHSIPVGGRDKSILYMGEFSLILW